MEYCFDNLLPGRHYHLDLSFAACSGEHWVDDKAVGDTNGEQPNARGACYQPAPNHANLLDPADYVDGSIPLSLKCANVLNGPVVSIIDLQEIHYCYCDSGPGETFWTAENKTSSAASNAARGCPNRRAFCACC